MNQILKESPSGRVVRILKPEEVSKLIKAIPKSEYKVMFKALLYSGCRYAELQRLKERPQDFDGDFIKVANMKSKAKVTQGIKRWVRLNPVGKEIIANYLELDKSLPHLLTWRENLRRWAVKAGIGEEGVCPKMTRKTWESWLTFFYEEKQITAITLSQGHTTTVSLTYYLGMPFTAEDKIKMEQYVGGWI